MTDDGVGAKGLVCQNFDEHDEEVEMVSGPYTGVMCPECGRMAGGGPPLDIPYVDEEEQRQNPDGLSVGPSEIGLTQAVIDYVREEGPHTTNEMAVSLYEERIAYRVVGGFEFKLRPTEIIEAAIDSGRLHLDDTGRWHLGA